LDAATDTKQNLPVRKHPIPLSKLPSTKEQMTKNPKEVGAMGNKSSVPLYLSIPEEYKEKLVIMAAKQNIKNPKRIATASALGREIICHFLDKMESEVRRGEYEQEDNNQ